MDPIPTPQKTGGHLLKGTRADPEANLHKAIEFYLSDLANDGSAAREAFAWWRRESVADKLIGKLPVYTGDDLPQVIAQLQRIHLGLAA